MTKKKARWRKDRPAEAISTTVVWSRLVPYVLRNQRENGPFMIILHPTNNLITRILIGKKQVELLNPQGSP